VKYVELVGGRLTILTLSFVRQKTNLKTYFRTTLLIYLILQSLKIINKSLRKNTLLPFERFFQNLKYKIIIALLNIIYFIF